MGIFTDSISKTTRKFPQTNPILVGPNINNFLGCDRVANKTAQPIGQLVINKNMEYWQSGTTYLKTKRGSTLILDITNYPYGAALYTYNLLTEKFIWIDGTAIKYCDTDGTNSGSIAAGLTTDKETYFVMYGQDTNAAMWLVNGVEAVKSLKGTTPTFAAVASSPILSDITFSTVGKRLIGIFGHYIYFTDQQVAAGVANLETWNTTVNFAIVSPDNGSGFLRCIDMGISGIYFLKDTGIWLHPNVSAATSEWKFPQVSNVGTRSPRTVCQGRYGESDGIFYLDSNRKVRFFSPVLVDNAGELPALEDKYSKWISEPFQDYLNNIPIGLLSKCTAYYWDGKYILNIVEAGGTDITKTIVIDCEKLLKPSGQAKIAQPFWFESVNMNYRVMVERYSNSALYGFSKDGFIAQLFVGTKIVEEIPTRITVTESYTDVLTTRSVAIEYKAYLAWIDFSGKYGGNRKLELNNGYLSFKSDGSWGFNFEVNSSLRGEAMSDYEDGITAAITPSGTIGAIFDVSFFDSSYFAGEDIVTSQNVSSRKKGHYFCFGIYSTTINQPISLYGIQPLFKVVGKDHIGLR